MRIDRALRTKLFFGYAVARTSAVRGASTILFEERHAGRHLSPSGATSDGATNVPTTINKMLAGPGRRTFDSHHRR